MKINKIIALSVAIIIMAGIWFLNEGKKADQFTIKDETFTLLENINISLTEEQITTVKDRLQMVEEKIAEEEAKAEKDLVLISKLYLEKGNQQYFLSDLNATHKSYVYATHLHPQNGHAFAYLFSFYMNTGLFDRAKEAIDKALLIEPKWPNYWISKFDMLKEKFDASPKELAEVYEKAYESVDLKINIVTHYAQYLASIGDIDGAKAKWEEAKVLFPERKDMYQKEIEELAKR